MAKKKSTQHVPTRTPSRRLLDGLEQADTLMRRKAWPQAREVLAALDRNYPREPEVLGRLVNVNYALNDMLGYQSAAERLLAVDPGEHDLRPALASAYLRNGLPTLALRTLREFLRLAPNHPKAGDARGMLADLERGLPALLAELGAEGGAGLKLAELHEEVQSFLNQGEYARARQAALGVLRQKPDIAPVLNRHEHGVTQAYAAEGYLSEALATTEQVLAFDPRNVHALSNRARILALLGRFDEGREAAHRMLASGAAAVDGWMKKAEALSYLAMDAEMLALFEGARLAEGSEQGLHDGVLWHLAAVAALKLRRENDARTWWQEASKRERGLTLATDNLNDLKKPVGQRNGPWAYDLRYWLSKSMVLELQREFGAGRKSEAAQGPARRFLRKHPEMEVLVPAWLDRGAPDMRKFSLMLIEAAATPELLAAAKEFALGQRGSDEQRMRAAPTGGAARRPAHRARAVLGRGPAARSHPDGDRDSRRCRPRTVAPAPGGAADRASAGTHACRADGARRSAAATGFGARTGRARSPKQPGSDLCDARAAGGGRSPLASGLRKESRLSRRPHSAGAGRGAPRRRTQSARAARPAAGTAPDAFQRICGGCRGPN
jgi:tetratricopeptide (TPR) repeat protein